MHTLIISTANRAIGVIVAKRIIYVSFTNETNEKRKTSKTRGSNCEPRCESFHFLAITHNVDRVVKKKDRKKKIETENSFLESSKSKRR